MTPRECNELYTGLSKEGEARREIARRRGEHPMPTRECRRNFFRGGGFRVNCIGFGLILLVEVVVAVHVSAN